jgi:hypothetical protein
MAARAAHGNIKRDSRTFNRFAWRNFEGGGQRLRMLFGDEGAAHAFNGRCHRWEVDRDFVSKPPPIVTRLLAPRTAIACPSKRPNAFQAIQLLLR